MSAWLLVPLKPTDDHIESIALRLDHGHGIRTIGWPMTSPPTMETDEQFAKRQEANRSTARKMYEEVTGQGFFKIERPKDFVCMTCGHSESDESAQANELLEGK